MLRPLFFKQQFLISGIRVFLVSIGRAGTILELNQGTTNLQIYNEDLNLLPEALPSRLTLRYLHDRDSGSHKLAPAYSTSPRQSINAPEFD